MFFMRSVGLSLLNSTYLSKSSVVSNITYHSFFISMFVLSEFLIFLSVFVVFLYYYGGFPYFLINLSYLDNFNFSVCYSTKSSLFILLSLTFILFSINQVFYVLHCLAAYSTFSLVCIDFLLTALLFSFVFTYTQYYELISQIIGIFDSVFSSVVYSLLLLHCSHVILGSACLLVLVVILNSMLPSLNSSFFYILQLCSWYWHLIDFVWLLLVFLVYAN